MQSQNRSSNDLINFTLNGKAASVEDGTTIMQLLKQKRIRPQVVTVEINGVILERDRFDQTEFEAGVQHIGADRLYSYCQTQQNSSGKDGGYICQIGIV
ncbi:MAG: sulfur carrier protein ThiS [Candidatus Poribacteria bacterium]